MREPAPRIFDDPFAIDLLSPRMRRLVTNPLLRGLQRLLLGALAPMLEEQVCSRSRFAEDALEQAMVAGATQFVLLSAGLDSFALRRPDLMARLQVFEVDHPDTQRFKRARLEDLGTALMMEHRRDNDGHERSQPDRQRNFKQRFLYHR